MEKLYYNKETGFVCERNPHYYPIDESTYIEVDKEVYNSTLSCEFGYIWAVRDDNVVLEEDAEVRHSDEYILMIKNNTLCKLKAYLNDTDYVITKLNELKLEDEDEYNEMKTKYADILAKRKECRKQINELESEN